MRRIGFNLIYLFLFCFALADISFAQDAIYRYCEKRNTCAHLSGGAGYVEYGERNARAQISQGDDLCEGIKVTPSEKSSLLITSNSDFTNSLSIDHPNSYIVNFCERQGDSQWPTQRQIISEFSGKLGTSRELDGGAYSGEGDFTFAIGGIATRESQVLNSRKQLVFLFNVPDGRDFIAKLIDPKGHLIAQEKSIGNAVVFRNLELQNGQWRIEAKDDFNNVINGGITVVKKEQQLTLTDQNNDMATLIESYNRVELNPKQNALSQINNLIDLGFSKKLPREHNIKYRNFVHLMVQSSNDTESRKPE